jgi:Uma2 family endonuclease
LSPTTRKVDEITKRKLYERFDVVEDWVVDPELEMAKIYRRDGGRFVRISELVVEHEDTLTTPLRPNFSVPVAELFAPPL